MLEDVREFNLRKTNRLQAVLMKFDDIEDIVRIISRVLGKDGIVIADLTDLNIDPFTECYFYLGERVRKPSFIEGYSKPDLCCMAYETEMENIAKWLV